MWFEGNAGKMAPKKAKSRKSTSYAKAKKEKVEVKDEEVEVKYEEGTKSLSLRRSRRHL